MWHVLYGPPYWLKYFVVCFFGRQNLRHKFEFLRSRAIKVISCDNKVRCTLLGALT